jgi:hypothetical protein
MNIYQTTLTEEEEEALNTQMDKMIHLETSAALFLPSPCACLKDPCTNDQRHRDGGYTGLYNTDFPHPG